ncbi:possible metalloprotease [Ectocarpus siliculosus]|uniref:Possible metalloprotease n=1 Tax=Ectocarpus siliculosus TaxID=2880 RepID=D7G933_ECTSI|nr:possible metalloprotease [Ectocarpus siliculosus]|eukprot:CBJ28194.1 possible metalloprotease [Ectocarpus siliculosus]
MIWPWKNPQGILVSPVEKRHYRWLLLPNGLQVMVISDPNANKAAAAMSVDVGAAPDPVGLPGLAHFLEHMAFLGTSKYPLENAYKSYLAKHGDRSNASAARRDIRLSRGSRWRQLRRPASAPRRLPTSLSSGARPQRSRRRSNLPLPAAPSTNTVWHHQRQQSSPLRTVVPPGKSEPITPADLAPSPTSRWHPRRLRCRRGSTRPHPAADTQASRWRGRSPALATTGRTKPVAPALPAQFPSLARSKRSAAEETAGAKFAAHPRMVVPRRGSSVSAPGSESSVDGSSSSLSWDDDRAEGWAAAGVASDDRSHGGFDWLPPKRTRRP